MEESKSELFDDWPERYDRWFETPIGSQVKACEEALVMEMLTPEPREAILDAGSGTGVFTLPIIAAGALVTGLDISLPMVRSSVPQAGACLLQPGGGRYGLTTLPPRCLRQIRIDNGPGVRRGRGVGCRRSFYGSRRRAAWWSRQRSTARAPGQPAGEKRRGKRKHLQEGRFQV